MPDALERILPIEVTHFQRRPAPGQHSIEMLAEDIRVAIPPDVEITVTEAPFRRGVLRRAWNVIVAWWSRGTVNHILGDVHYLALLLPPRRTIVTVLDCAPLQRLTGLRHRLYWLLWFHLPLRRVAHVTVISEFTRRQLLEHVDLPPERLTVIPPPISGVFERSTSPTKTQRPRLLQVGTRPNKNLARVIEAVAELDVELVIIGRIPEQERSLLEIHEVKFENHVDLTRGEVVDQYRKCDAVVFVSTYEGFGMPIVEAQATGRPVITSDLSPMRETAGGAACLIDPMSVPDIRRGIEAVLAADDYASSLVERGIVNARRYMPDRIASEYVRLYRTIACETDTAN